MINTEHNGSDALRLNYIANSLDEIIKNYKPDIAVIEKIFVSNSGESALKLGMARGVALNSLVSQKKIIIKELAARYIKKAITGTGAADKDQIKYMIEKLLGKIVVQSDAADHLYSQLFRKPIKFSFGYVLHLRYASTQEKKLPTHLFQNSYDGHQ